MKREDLKIGECYVYYNDCLLIFEGIGKTVKCINLNSKTLGTCNFEFTLSPIRLATHEEKHWLDVCIKDNKYVSLEDATLSFRKPPSSDFIYGKWYKSNYDTRNGNWFYLKAKHYSNERSKKLSGETISSDGVYSPDDYWDYSPPIDQALNLGPLTDLTEIQKFLPKGHMDKINKTTSNRVILCATKYEWDSLCDSKIGKSYEIQKNWFHDSPKYMYIDEGLHGESLPSSAYYVYNFYEFIRKYDIVIDNVNTMSLQDVKADQYYYAEYEEKRYDNIIIKPTQNGSFAKCPGLIVEKEMYLGSNTWNAKQNIRFATPDEIEHLDCCRAHGTYMSKERAKELGIKKVSKPEPSLFLKDEYIVILTDSSTNSFLTNHVYKQREDYKYLRVYKDENSERNGLLKIEFTDKHLWRYATKQEIMEYDIQDRPVNVTRIGMANLPAYEPDPVGYVIPSNAKKWAVKRTHANCDILNKWANSQDGAFGHSSAGGWIHSINYGYGGHTGGGHYYADDTKHPDHTEITTDQFKREYMNDEPKVTNEMRAQLVSTPDNNQVVDIKAEVKWSTTKQPEPEKVSLKDKSLGEICDLCNQMFPIGSVVDFSEDGSDLYTIKEKLYIGSSSYISYDGLPIVYRWNEDTLRCKLVSNPIKSLEDSPKKAKMSDVSTLVKHQEPVIVHSKKAKRSKLIIINK